MLFLISTAAGCTAEAQFCEHGVRSSSITPTRFGIELDLRHAHANAEAVDAFTSSTAGVGSMQQQRQDLVFVVVEQSRSSGHR